MQPKVRRVKGSVPQQTEKRFFLHSRNVWRKCKNKRPGEEEEKQKCLMSTDLTPISQKYSNQLLTTVAY